jgi:lysophospholipid acyltransferase
VLLTLPASFLVWARVYFYAVIGTALSTAFFASPAKLYLIKKINDRSGGSLKRIHSQESLASNEPVLGLPPDPQMDLEEAVQEVKAEMAARQRKGARRAETVPVPSAKAS